MYPGVVWLYAHAVLKPCWPHVNTLQSEATARYLTHLGITLRALAFDNVLCSSLLTIRPPPIERIAIVNTPNALVHIPPVIVTIFSNQRVYLNRDRLSVKRNLWITQHSCGGKRGHDCFAKKALKAQPTLGIISLVECLNCFSYLAR